MMFVPMEKQKQHVQVKRIFPIIHWVLTLEISIMVVITHPSYSLTDAALKSRLQRKKKHVAIR